MAFDKIKSLLGVSESDPMAMAVGQEFSKSFGRDVKVLPTVKGGYRTDKNGTVWLADFDEDDPLINLIFYLFGLDISIAANLCAGLKKI